MVALRCEYPGDTTGSPVRSMSHGMIALLNLDAQIEGLERYQRPETLAIESRAELVDLLILRGLVTGSIADYELAARRAAELTDEFPTESSAWLARARARATFHHFQGALDDLAHGGGL